MSVDKRGRTYRACLKDPAGNSPTCLTTGATLRPSPGAFAAANPGLATFSPAPTPATRTIGPKPTSQPWPPSAADSSPLTTPNGPPNRSTPPSDSPPAAKATPYAATRKTPYHPTPYGCAAATCGNSAPRPYPSWDPAPPATMVPTRPDSSAPASSTTTGPSFPGAPSASTAPSTPRCWPAAEQPSQCKPAEWGPGQRIPARRHPATAPVPHPKPTHCRPQLRHRHH